MTTRSRNAVSSHIATWAIVHEPNIDISFVPRQHRRRLSRTTQLALTAYHRCNPELEPCRTVFASRYGEYARTFGIMESLAKDEPASPAAFSVSVHNAPAGILGIATENTQPSTTIAANQSTIEAGFLEAAMQRAELPASEDLIFIFVDEPLPDLYADFRSEADVAYALGLRLTAAAARRLDLTWSPVAQGAGESRHGVPDAGHGIAGLLEAGRGALCNRDERLQWEWSVG